MECREATAEKTLRVEVLQCEDLMLQQKEWSMECAVDSGGLPPNYLWVSALFSFLLWGRHGALI